MAKTFELTAHTWKRPTLILTPTMTGSGSNQEQSIFQLATEVSNEIKTWILKAKTLTLKKTLRLQVILYLGTILIIIRDQQH